MKFICIDCGNVFDPEDIAIWQESREYWGGHCVEHRNGCPQCHGSYEEAESCEVCREHTFKDRLYGGVCEECIGEYSNNFDVCLAISRQEPKTTIKINPLICDLTGGEDEIEEILLDYIRSQKEVNCENYIEEDISWFGEKLAKEVKNDENAKG